LHGFETAKMFQLTPGVERGTIVDNIEHKILCVNAGEVWLADQEKVTGAPAPAYSAYVVGVLLAIYILNFLDRQIVAILAAPIQKDLGLSDLQLGLVTGLAFAVFYSLLGLPLAWVADRFNRIRLLSIACALWSAMTAVCGLANSFLTLFLARIGVGVGEAACVPASHSIISDYFGPEGRTKALAIFAMGIPVGTLAGLWVGGVVADNYGWRVAFFLLGVPGIALAFLAWLTVREPARAADAPPAPQLSVAVRQLVAQPGFVRLTLASALASLAGYGLVAFLGVFFVRQHGLSLSQIGFGLGLTIGIGGALGSLMGGYLRTVLGSVHRARRGAAIGLLAATPFILAALWAESAVLAFAWLLLVSTFNAFWYGPVFAEVQGLAAPRTRAMAAAVFNLVVNLIGLGLGPTIIGGLSDIAAAAGAEPGPALRVGLASSVMFNIIAAGLLLSVRARDDKVSETNFQETTETPG
jgi:MFS transporter, Spinster family, sphingosine-1-phosphate transporter